VGQREDDVEVTRLKQFLAAGVDPTLAKTFLSILEDFPSC
jgi:hypothetical protein